MHLNFRIVFRGSKTNMFPEHLVFLMSDNIKDDHLRRCPITDREKLAVKCKGSLIWEN